MSKDGREAMERDENGRELREMSSERRGGGKERRGKRSYHNVRILFHHKLRNWVDSVLYGRS